MVGNSLSAYIVCTAIASPTAWPKLFQILNSKSEEEPLPTQREKLLDLGDDILCREVIHVYFSGLYF